MLKKILSVFLSVLLAAVFLAPKTYALTFSDVPKSEAFKTAIEFLSDEGIVNGNPDGTFRPLNKLNRAEMIKIVAEGAAAYYHWPAGIFDPFNEDKCFKDIGVNQWYTKYLCYAKENDWVEGYEDDTFRPSQLVSFPEALKMTYKGFKMTYDEDATPWYKNLAEEAFVSKYLYSSNISDTYKLQRNQMADLITRIIKDNQGELDDYLETVPATYEPEPEPQSETEILSNLNCPDFKTGSNSMNSAGFNRTFEVILPDETYNAPVIYIWHAASGSGARALGWTNAYSLAAKGYIIISPDAAGDSSYEWHYNDASKNPDTIFFDESLACLKRNLNIDADRVYSTGFSAGGVFTTFLAMNRAQDLAAVTILSGGTNYYKTPASKIPVLIAWGGSTDIAASYNFETASNTFVNGLRKNGHFVITCVGSYGHSIPWDSSQMLDPFFSAHVRGQATPFSSTNLPGIPDWCSAE